MNRHIILIIMLPNNTRSAIYIMWGGEDWGSTNYIDSDEQSKF